MCKTAITALALVLCLGMIIVTVNAQEDIKEIDNSVFKNPQRPPSIFNHDEHNEKAEIYECSECHHVYENGVRVEGESSEDQYCSDCHALKKSSDGKPPLMKAFHTNCKGCHMEKTTGPLMCGECHVKESLRHHAPNE